MTEQHCENDKDPHLATEVKDEDGNTIGYITTFPSTLTDEVLNECIPCAGGVDHKPNALCGNTGESTTDQPDPERPEKSRIPTP